MFRARNAMHERVRCSTLSISLASKSAAPINFREASSNVLRLPAGRMTKGAPADLIVFDPGAPRKIDPVEFRSRSKNSPFKGRLMQGRVSRTMVAGNTVFAAQ